VRKFAKVVVFLTCASVVFAISGCTGGNPEAKDSTVAATVNGRSILLREVERAVTAQSGGQQAKLSQLELAQARLQILSNLIQREVLFQRAEREKLLPTPDEIEGAINAQKQQTGMTQEEFDKSLKQQNVSIETLREEARKELAIAKLQDKYSGKVSISDREVEEYYAANKDQFVSSRGVALAMIAVDPQNNSAQGISNDDAKNETDAKVKIDNIYQQLKGGADFATVARARSEDSSLTRGGDIGFAGEEQLKQNGFPAEIVSQLFGPAMQVGSFTNAVKFSSPQYPGGRWYIFKLQDRRLQTENLTLESQGIRQQITQGLTNQRKQILNAALLEVAINEAKIVNNLAGNMINNPGNLGLRPVSPGSEPAAAPAATQSQAPASTASPAASPAGSTK